VSRVRFDGAHAEKLRHPLWASLPA
jgi:hypothetical protein